jgi:2-C-methyl-D-erythritol 2,4-cyclodiphosphate synthase
VAENIDSTVVAEKPRLSPYIPRMVEKIARALDLPLSQVNVKATTSEGLGFVGGGKGIAAYAVVLLRKVSAPKAPSPLPRIRGGGRR